MRKELPRAFLRGAQKKNKRQCAQPAIKEIPFKHMEAFFLFYCEEQIAQRGSEV